MGGGRLRELEALRGAAALYVVAHHTLRGAMTAIHPLAAIPFRFGQEAVIIFFLLSGYVIHYSVRQRGEFNLVQYGVARVRRIYPIFLAALLISYAAASINAGELIDPDLRSLFGNLLMLQDRSRPGTIVLPYMGNSPLWSLSYEWFFYLVYAGLQLALPRQRQPWAVMTAGGLALLALPFFPNQMLRFLAYLLIWWTGVEMCEFLSFKDSWKRLGAMLAVLALGAIVWGVVVSIVGPAKPTDGEGVLGAYPVLELRHFVVALLFATALTAWSLLGWRGFNRVFGAFSVVAPISYAIYVLHWPVMVTLNESGRLMSARPVWLLVSFGLLIAVAWLLEGPLQRAIPRLERRSRRQSPEELPA